MYPGSNSWKSTSCPRSVCVCWRHFLLCKTQPILGFCDSPLLPASLHWSCSFPRLPSSSLAGWLFCVEVDVTFAVRRSKGSLSIHVLGWGWVGSEVILIEIQSRKRVFPILSWSHLREIKIMLKQRPQSLCVTCGLVKLKMWWTWKLPWGYGEHSLHNLAKRKTIWPTHPQTLEI